MTECCCIQCFPNRSLPTSSISFVGFDRLTTRCAPSTSPDGLVTTGRDQSYVQMCPNCKKCKKSLLWTDEQGRLSTWEGLIIVASLCCFFAARALQHSRFFEEHSFFSNGHCIIFLDAIASPSSYPCQPVSQWWVSEWLIVSDLEIAIASPSFASLFLIVCLLVAWVALNCIQSDCCSSIAWTEWKLKKFNAAWLRKDFYWS